MSINNKYIEIGKIVNTFGIKGELKVTSDSDFINYRFQKGKKVYFKYGKEYLEKTISSYRILKGNVVITIDNINDINQVVPYIGVTIYADINDIPPLEKNSYFVNDLIGLDVYLEDNTLYGKVSDVINLPANDCLEITLKNQTTKLIPFINDFVISIEKDKITIKVLEEEVC